MPKYGLISQTDANTLELTLRLIFEHFPNEIINVLEVGCYAGETGNGMREFIDGHGRKCSLTGVDNNQDNEHRRFEYDRLLIGDSVQRCGDLPSDYFHIGLIDANHSFHRVIADFVAYDSKIKVGGYLLFHDTNPNIKTFQDYQKVGSNEDERMYIQVRNALTAIGLFDGAFPEWELVMDKFDEKNQASGFCVFKKL